MALLGFGKDYLCEACKFFNTDGEDGNHPYCKKQFEPRPHIAILVEEQCPYGYEFGIPDGYPVSMKRNKERAYEIKVIIDSLNLKN